jgi:hypothetical protein
VAEGTLPTLLARRLLLVAGKGGTGKSTIAAALALLAAREGKRVLCIEVDAKGDLSRQLGADPAGFRPRVVQPNISVLQLKVEESLQEYLNIYFKVPRLARLTPLARVFDFVATGVPGAKDMLVIGKIAYEEKRREANGGPMWDMIIVDAAATGEVLPQLRAARAMLELVRGGIIRGQVEWIDAMLTDPQRTLLTICALPEEMPVVEAIELHDRTRAETKIGVGACFLNRMMPVSLSPREQQLAERLAGDGEHDALARQLGGDPRPVAQGALLAQRLHRNGLEHARRLRAGMSVPVIEVPLLVTPRAGLATSRAVAAALEGAAA